MGSFRLLAVFVATGLALPLLCGTAIADDAAIRARCAALAARPAQTAGATTYTTVTAGRTVRRAVVPARGVIRSVAPGRVARVPIRSAPHFHGGGVAGLVAGVVVASVVSAAISESARQDAERNCLVSHGLIKTPKAAGTHAPTQHRVANADLPLCRSLYSSPKGTRCIRGAKICVKIESYGFTCP